MLNLDRTKISLFTIVKLCYRYSPVLFLMSLLLTVLDGLLVPLMLVVVANFIDSALTLASEDPQVYTVVINAIFMGLGYLYTQLSQELKLYFYELLEDRLRNELKPDIIKKQFSIDYLLFEMTQTQDLLLRVTTEIEKRFVKILRSVNSIITIAVQVVGILYALYQYEWWIVLVFAFIIVPMVYLTFKGGKAIYESVKKVGFITRQMNYLSDLLSNREASAERTLFRYSGTLNERFKDAHLFRSNFNTKNLAREIIRIKLSNIVMNIFTIVIIVALSRQVHNNLLSVGLFTSIVGSMINLTKVISVELSELFFQFSSHNEYVKDFKEFIGLEENPEVFVNESEAGLQFESLEIKDLYFKYKDSEDYIIKGINLRLEKGKSYSLVGLNGAGKTTLIKILVGLYRDFEGEILVNGKDIKSYTFNQLRSIFSVVSQDYAKYYVTLRDNVAFSAEAEISSVIEKVELDDLIRDLPDGENSYLGKMYDNGVDLSGGQWQRIAIARALYKDAPFVILDEPTSSLSPTAESRVYQNFSEIANDRTLLMISHRLGSTKISDEIIVLDSGQIAEMGSHEELMKQDHLYAKLFKQQREWYYD